jgi:hypothetical protein
VKFLLVIEDIKKGNDPLQFEQWIFHYDQPIRGDDRRIFESVTEHHRYNTSWNSKFWLNFFLFSRVEKPLKKVCIINV